MFFVPTRFLQIVKRNDSPGLLWKKIKLTPTRKANAKKRLRRVWQVKSQHLKPPPSNSKNLQPTITMQEKHASLNKSLVPVVSIDVMRQMFHINSKAF
jgi:hypothetical protein